MGCSASCPANFIAHQKDASSKSSLLSPFSPFAVSRTLSFAAPLIHHPPVKKGDSNHFVSLTSSTYGSLMLVDHQHCAFTGEDFVNATVKTKRAETFGKSEDSSSPISVINTWELMEGLDEEGISSIPNEIGNSEKSFESDDHPKSKPLWKHLSEESLLSKMGQNVVSSYQKALLGKGKTKPQKIKPLECQNPKSSVSSSDQSFRLIGSEDKIVLYYTSLRGIRKTYEDCVVVRTILSGFRVRVDERDTSMDASYRKELQEAVKGDTLSLPQVFIRGKYIGGAEEIKNLNEMGELAKLLEGFRVVDCGLACKFCGDVRFVPCRSCDGSRKVYDEEEDSLRRCSVCNENGLIRCSFCLP